MFCGGYVLRLKKQLSTNFILCEMWTKSEELVELQACYAT